MLFTSQSMTSKQRCTYDHLLIFCDFGLQHVVPNTPNFWLLIECIYRMMVEWPEFITFASFRIYWRGSLWINVFKRSSNPKGLPELGVSLMSKREIHFLAMLSLMAFSHYTAQVFLAASAAFAPLLNSKRRICQKCSNFPAWHSHFLASMVSLTIFKWQNFNM